MKDTLSRILAVIGILTGIGTLVALYVVWSLAMEHKAVFTDMLDTYDGRVAMLEEKVNKEEPEDTRALMPEDYRGTLAAINTPASELVEYRNSDIGLAMKVPYNPNWGNRLYRVRPYEEHQYPDAEGIMRTVVQFEASFVFEGGGWARAYTLAASDPLTVDDEITHTLAMNEGFLVEDRPLEELNVNGKTVLVTYTSGLCDLVQITVIGEKANYMLNPTCGNTDEIREELLNVVRTMEFINE